MKNTTIFYKAVAFCLSVNAYSQNTNPIIYQENFDNYTTLSSSGWQTKEFSNYDETWGIASSLEWTDALGFSGKMMYSNTETTNGDSQDPPVDNVVISPSITLPAANSTDLELSALVGKAKYSDKELCSVYIISESDYSFQNITKNFMDSLTPITIIKLEEVNQHESKNLKVVLNSFQNQNVRIVFRHHLSPGDGFRMYIDHVLIQKKSALGLSEDLLKNKIQVFPIPAKEILHVKTEEKNSFKIVNITGKILKTGVLDKGENTIDINELIPGNYLLKMNNSSVKFIKK